MTPLVRAACRAVFELTLVALPRGFRAEAGAEMRETFDELAAIRWRRGGNPALIAFALQSCIGALRVGLEERRSPTSAVVDEAGQSQHLRRRGGEGMGTMIEGWLLDVRHAARTIRRQPGFTALAIGMLAVGIGGTTGIYTLVHRLLLSPLPGLAEPDRLVSMGVTSPDMTFATFPYPVYERLEDVDAFTGVVATSRISLSLLAGDAPDAVTAEIVSGNYFDVLGVSFAAGRAFDADETAPPDGPLVAVMSHRTWTDRYGADPSVVGSDVTLNGRRFTVVGVTQRDFVGLSLAAPAPEFWVPLSTYSAAMPNAEFDPFTSMGDFWLSVAGRLADGVTETQAQAAVDGFVRGLQEAAPGASDDYGILVTGNTAMPHPAQRRDTATVLALLIGVVAAVLAIVCSNLANLFLNRSITRRREVGIRVALGSGRARVVRQLLLESGMTAVAGGVLGLLLAKPIADAVVQGYGQPIALSMAPDATVATFALLLGIATGILFGLPPALDAARGDPSRTMTEHDGSSVRSPRVRSALAVAQVALSTVLVVGSALFARSLGNIAAIDPGFDPDGLVVVDVAGGNLNISDDEARALYRDAVERAAAIPGVRSATLSLNTPFGGSWRGGGFDVEGTAPTDDEDRPDAYYNVLWPGYFGTLGTPLLRGRDFALSDDETAPPVAIVTESFAQRFWPGEDALGKRIRRGGPDTPWIEVVGVVADSKYGSLDEATEPFFFRPLLQRLEQRVVLIVRADAPTASLFSSLRTELRSLDPDLPALRIRTVDALVAKSLARQRMAASVTGGFTLLALLLAALGIYGLLSYGVSQRTREIGLRMALGAERARVTGMITRQGLTLTGVGLALGVVGAGAATRAAAPLLYDVDPLDPLAFLGAAAVLTAVTLAACWIPARRASRVDPSEALRYD